MKQLETLFAQMKNEMSHLSEVDKLRIKTYMIWAFDRGVGSIINKIKSGN